MKNEIVFSEQAWEDYLYWQQADKNILKRINMLIRSIQQEPYAGVGKPERLRYGLSSY